MLPRYDSISGLAGLRASSRCDKFRHGDSAANRAAASTRVDEERMREVFAFTARTLETAHPVPFGALIVNTRTGKRLMQRHQRGHAPKTIPAPTPKRAPCAWPARN